jgi:hypothetical protein
MASDKEHIGIVYYWYFPNTINCETRRSDITIELIEIFLPEITIIFDEFLEGDS